jgi:hypothetical protein
MKKKVEKMKDGFARWGAFIRGATFFHHEIFLLQYFLCVGIYTLVVAGSMIVYKKPTGPLVVTYMKFICTLMEIYKFDGAYIKIYIYF